MRKKQLYATFMAAVMSVSLLTGCGGSGGQTAADEDQQNTQEQADVPQDAGNAETEVVSADQGGGDSSAREAEAFGYQLNLDPSNTLNGQYEGQTLTVFCCTGEFSEPLQESIDLFQKLSGAAVNLYIYSFDELNSKISLALAGDEEMDVTCFVSAYMDTFNSVGQLADLTEISRQYGAEDYDWNGFSDALIERTSDESGVFAVPYQVCEMMGFYRKDLLEDPDIQAAYKEKTGKDLTVPATTEELEQVAQFFTRSENPESPTTYGYLTQGTTNASMWSWMSRLGSFGGSMFNDGWEPAFNNQAGVDAMNYNKKLMSFSPANWNEYGFDEVNALMASGEAFFCETWSSAYPSINAGEMAGKIGCCVTPGSSPVISGWSLGINSLSEKQELAWKFIEFCTSKDGEMTRVDNGVAPARDENIKRLMDAGEDTGYYTAITDSFACEKNCWGDICLPYLGSQGSSIVDTYTQAMYKDSISAEEALESMETEIKEALKSVGIGN